MKSRGSLSWPTWYLVQSLRGIQQLTEQDVDDETLMRVWRGYHEGEPPRQVVDTEAPPLVPRGARYGWVQLGDEEYQAARLGDGRVVRLVGGRMFRCTPDTAASFRYDPTLRRDAG